MSQKASTVNFLIHDANGQPQMVKVVKGASNQPVAHIKIKPNPVKLVKIPTTTDGSVQAPAVFQTLKLAGLSTTPKLVQVPVDTLARWKQVTPKVESVEADHLETEQAPAYQTVKLSGLSTTSKLVQVPVDTLARWKQVTPKAEPADQLEIEQSTEIDLEEAVPEFACAPDVGPSARLAPAMSHGTRRRHDSDNDAPAEYTTKRRKHADKVGKGLRHFSMKVCEKVRTKGFTSYNEVAEELVLEFTSGMHGSSDNQQYDQKNIRRRVYDALNVLMAMNIISKEKKEIRWLGLPTNSIQECNTLEKEKQSKIEQIQKKTQQLQELILQHISFKSLIERNKEAENRGVKPSPSSAIHLPFIVVNTSDKALIDCSISNDKTEYMFNFNKRFQIHDDIDILKRMGLLFGLDKGECSDEDIERAKSMIPKSLETFVEQMGRGEPTQISALLEEEANNYTGEEEDTLEGEIEEEGEVEAEDEHDGDGNEYSDDSSDVDV